MKALSRNQQDVMDTLSNYNRGESKFVTTSQYGNYGVLSARPVAYCSAVGLRGLEKRGLIKIQDYFWRGAMVSREVGEEIGNYNR